MLLGEDESSERKASCVDLLAVCIPDKSGSPSTLPKYVPLPMRHACCTVHLYLMTQDISFFSSNMWWCSWFHLLFDRLKRLWWLIRPLLWIVWIGICSEHQAYQSDVYHILQTLLFHHETSHHQSFLFERGNGGHNYGYASSFWNWVYCSTSKWDCQHE